MLKSIYILDENGILLFSRNFMREKYDDNILIGFFSSITNFSREALGSIVKNVDLGENNKLIIAPASDENLLGAAIVSSNDNNNLVSSILKDIVQDFIDTYSPDYDPDKIFQDEMENIIEDNLKGKTMRSPLKRIFASWLIAGFLSYFLIFISIIASSFIYSIFRLERFINPGQLFTRFMPSLIILSTLNIIILFLLPNLILGFLSPNWKIAVVNSIIFLAVTITLYFFSIEPNFAYIVISNLPLTLIFSLFFLFIGIRYSSKRFLKK
ncbi:MAG: hypothetical protein ACFE8J_12425 [Candidatus Heimdallarchaeota archaeon]